MSYNLSQNKGKIVTPYVQNEGNGYPYNMNEGNYCILRCAIMIQKDA